MTLQVTGTFGITIHYQHRRILEYAKWDDIWRYLTVADIRQNFELLHFRRPQDREL